MSKYFALLGFIFSPLCFSAQDDVTVILRSPYALYDGNETDKFHFLSDFAFRGAFGTYIFGDEIHKWQFKSAGDVVLLSIGSDYLWRAGVNLEGVADGKNDINFRIAQSLYEVFTAFEGRLGFGVFYGGYRHRCKHGADNTDARIVMRSGPELGYNSFFDLGPVDVIWNTMGQVFIAGQNKDISHHPRAYFSTVAQVDYKLSSFLKLFASGGIGIVLVGKSSMNAVGGFEKIGADSNVDKKIRYVYNNENYKCVNEYGNSCGSYSLLTSVDALYGSYMPAGAIGIQFLGERGEMRIYSSAHSNLDTGFTDEVHKSIVFSLTAEFIM